MILYDSDFEKLKLDFENGKIAIEKLTENQIEMLSNYYKKEIETNKRDILITNKKIKNLKNKIDNLV